MLFDGSRALIVGDYITPRTGSTAGQLGPWSRLVAALGIDPRGTTMKCIHVTLGFLWIGAAVCFLLKPSLGWFALLLMSIGSLWYLPIGTLLSVMEIGLLFLPALRSLK